MKLIATVVAIAVLLRSASAVLVAPGSDCEVQCGNVADSTTPADITCSKNAYDSTTAGAVFKKCIQCEAKSNYTSNNQSDVQWMLCT
jgi:hypothetical protein